MDTVEIVQPYNLIVTERSGGRVQTEGENHWRLSIPPGDSRAYRWAQLDDYQPYARQNFIWHLPVRLSLRARVSGLHLAGTWGFGLWNDPFSLGLMVRGSKRKLPALPNAAWFFYASPPNHLALRDNHPADGLLAATFAAPRLPGAALIPAAPAVPFLLWQPSARMLRRLARLPIKEDAETVRIDPQAWHDYAIEWQSNHVRFIVDGAAYFDTRVSPHGPLGFVLWIDNQYAAFEPGGNVRFGVLPNDEEQWLEVENLQIQRMDVPHRRPAAQGDST